MLFIIKTSAVEINNLEAEANLQRLIIKNSDLASSFHSYAYNDGNRRRRLSKTEEDAAEPKTRRAAFAR